MPAHRLPAAPGGGLLRPAGGGSGTPARRGTVPRAVTARYCPLLPAGERPWALAAQAWKPGSQHDGQKRPRFDPWVRKIPWRRKWQLTPVSLP